jgi:tRNA pseudouridine55 synthase
MKLSCDILKEGKILPVNKPASWTSFDVVKKIRSLTGIKKIGHAGTLDPFATGLLLVCTGSATKKVTELIRLSKEYVGEIEFGYETDTMDLTGEKIKEADPPLLKQEKVQIILESFRGQTQQEIPSYSAVKYKGRRLYKSARKGEEVPQLFREITIYDIELIEIRDRSIVIRIECGSGTYVRTLARDIARKLDTAGHLKTLVRTRIGDYTLNDAMTIEDLEKELPTESIRVRKEKIR